MAELVAEAFLSSLFQVILESLASGDFRDYFSRNKLDVGLLEKLGTTLNSINLLLEEAEEKQYQSTCIKEWLDDLTHATYEADQLLDEIATDASLEKLKAESQSVSSKVTSFYSAFTSPFESRIKEVLEKLEFLEKQKDMLGLKGGTCASNEVGVNCKPSKRSPTIFSMDESSIYGRDVDKEEIINFLLSDNCSSNRVPIISIVGLGGIGKTTLAQLVYNDHRIKEHFERMAWVYVSESFDVVRLTKKIIGSSLYCLARGENLNLLQQQLQEGLTGKKYLLVLDDVWGQNRECWDQLLLPFNHGFFGSKIIVTTRDEEVPSIMKSIHLLHLKQLEESHCWSLFVRYAFHGKNVSKYRNLESIGKKIVDKCGGLPLAIKTLGGLLRLKFSPPEWVKILETDVCRFSDGSSIINIDAILRLCYHNFPSDLKRCFAYCSIFPKGNRFSKDQLIKLWMAEGLLKGCGTDRSEEQLGNEFFDDLQLVSFLQQSLYPRNNSEYRFIMHDLVIDLAKSVSGELNLHIEDKKMQDIPERTRHIWCSLDLKDADKKLEHIYKIKGLRSLMVHTERSSRIQDFNICNNVQHDLFSRLKYLKMLSFSGCNLSKLVDEISNLKLLRYLDLSYTGITGLPDSICMLYNLQTLILEQCRLTELPSNFYKLINLRHLNLESTAIKKMPEQIERLNHLQTLTDFVVGDNSGSSIKELAKLNHLQGTLCISGLEHVIDPTDAAKANLNDKKHLEELYMRYGYGRETGGPIIERDVLEALQPNSNLGRLIIEVYRGNGFPSWLGDGHLANLVSLELQRCELCSQLPPLGQLPSLKELSISGCSGIQIIAEEFYGYNLSNVPFRSLEILRFDYMSDWNEWLCPIGFPSLTCLFITNCPKLKKALPQHLPSLNRLVIFDCQELECSIPASVRQLEIDGCVNILINALPCYLKSACLGGTRVIESSLEKILYNNSYLEKLDVSDFDGANLEWSSLDLRSYNSIRSLSIRDWRSSCLPFALHLFTNLHSLNLYDCPQLESFPRGGLPSSLRSLKINKCPKLIASREKWGLFELNSLKELRVSDDFENVESFPEESLLPPNIYSLRLEYCSKLRIINYKGLLHLKSLRLLGIEHCPCLERLPEEGLPNSLSTLAISGCSLLEQLYQKEKGERWHKIHHIADVIIY